MLHIEQKSRRYENDAEKSEEEARSKKNILARAFSKKVWRLEISDKTQNSENPKHLQNLQVERREKKRQNGQKVNERIDAEEMALSLIGNP